MQEDPLQRLAMITFMPDRSRDPNLHAVNQQNFRTLANALATAETVSLCRVHSILIQLTNITNRLLRYSGLLLPEP